MPGDVYIGSINIVFMPRPKYAIDAPFLNCQCNSTGEVLEDVLLLHDSTLSIDMSAHIAAHSQAQKEHGQDSRSSKLL